MSVGERIAELRKKNNISQVQLAAAMSVSRQAVSKWENDQSAPDTMNMIRLADLLNTDIEYLSSGRHTPKPAPVIVEYKPKEIQIQEKIVEKVIEVPKLVEKIVEKEVVVDRPVERIVEKPVLKRVIRFRYRTDPVLIFLVGFVCALLGFLVGHFL